MTWHGIPREKIPWFPAIDREKCEGCGTCVEFCRNGVYALKEKAEVENPYSCVVGCSTCQGLCPSGAITFPEIQSVRKIIQTLKGGEAKA